MIQGSPAGAAVRWALEGCDPPRPAKQSACWTLQKPTAGSAPDMQERQTSSKSAPNAEAPHNQGP